MRVREREGFQINPPAIHFLFYHLDYHSYYHSFHSFLFDQDSMALLDSSTLQVTEGVFRSRSVIAVTAIGPGRVLAAGYKDNYVRVSTIHIYIYAIYI